jgi:hypothetical protein
MTHQFQVGQREIAGLPYIDWNGWRIVDTKDGKLSAINLAQLDKLAPLVVPADTDQAEQVQRWFYKHCRTGNTIGLPKPLSESDFLHPGNWQEVANANGDPFPPPAQVQAEAKGEAVVIPPSTGPHTGSTAMAIEIATLRRELAEAKARTIADDAIQMFIGGSIDAVPRFLQLVGRGDLAEMTQWSIENYRKQLTLSQDRVKVLEDALRPFAEIAETYQPGMMGMSAGDFQNCLLAASKVIRPGSVCSGWAVAVAGGVEIAEEVNQNTITHGGCGVEGHACDKYGPTLYR